MFDLVVIHTFKALVKLKSEKEVVGSNQVLNFPQANFTTSRVVCITVMINHVFISFSLSLKYICFLAF